jgi:formyl-CoA transferase
MTGNDGSGALSAYTVLDLTRVRAGPTAVRQLADWGAHVIKVEAPPVHGDLELGGPRHAFDFQNLHRNKRSLTLNLKHPDGVAVFHEMVKSADVVVENYRPAVKQRLGVDYETLRAINPRLVYGSISGFGETGPYRDRPGVDQIAQGMGGLMSITGETGRGPMRVGIPIADLTAGLYCAIGIMVALLEREASGEGQWVTTSLLQAQIAMLDFQAARWLKDGEVPGQAGNDHPTGIPTGVFRTSDGHINIGASGGQLYDRMCHAMGAEELLTDPRYVTDPDRSTNRHQLNADIEAYTVTRTTAEWVEALNHAGVPCGPINSIDETFADPQVEHLGMAAPLTHPTLGPTTVVGQGVSLSRTGFNIHSAPPDQGQHTEAVLREYGFDDDKIESLRADGAI